MKKIFAIILALAMTFALSAVALATAPVTEGTITIQNPVNGKEYKAYKIFDLSYSGTNYTYTIKADSRWFTTVQGYTTGLTLTQMPGNTSTYAVTFTDAFDASTFAAYLKQHLDGDSTASPTIPAINPAPTPEAHRTAANPQTEPLKLTTNGEAPATNPDNTKVPLGYYFVTSGAGAVCSLNSSSPDIIIYEKNTNGTTPGFNGDGKTFADSADGTTADGGSAQIGDTLYYRIEAHVPQYLGSYPVATYVFTDELPAGLTFVTDSVTVELYPGIDANGKPTGTKITLTKGTADTSDYKVTEPTTTSNKLIITVNVDDIENYYPDAYIVIKYRAKVDEDAVFANKNVVTLTWTLGTSGVQDPEPTPTPGSNPPEDNTTVKVYGFILNKTKGNTQETLDGALFKLMVNKGTAQTPNWQPVTLVLESGTTHDPAVPSGVTGVGNYYRVYNEDETLAQGDKKIDYSGDPLDPEGEKTFIQAGKVSIFGLDPDKTYVLQEVKAPNGYNPITDNIEIPLTNMTEDADGWLDTVKDVQNNEGSQLPSTGGIGTTIFYIIGGLLMVGAVVLLVVRKKMSVTE